MSKEKNFIPELRFPEFEKSGVWHKKCFDELFEIGSGRDYKHLEKGDIPVYGSGGYMLSVNDYLHDGESACIGRKGTIDNPIFLRGKFWTVDTLYYTHSFKDCLPKYIYYLFQTINWLKYNEAGGIPSLTKSIIYEIETLLPKPDEQQKIVDCLSSLDELITAHNNKLEALKEHKKGLLQNLFPQEDEKVPNYRFPEFENNGGWEEMKLGDEEVSDMVNDKVDSKKLNLNNYISTGNMLPDYAGITTATKLPTTQRVTNFFEGDILFSNIRPYLKKVWKSDREGGASNDVIVFRCGKKVLTDFLEHLIKNNSFIHYVMKSAKGVKMPRGDKDSMKEYKVLIPSKEEQQKIASCLSTVDELIKVQVEKLEQLELHKKGLIQGLFPKIKD